jgi:hypothetical protein
MRRQVNPDAHWRALFRYPDVAGRTAAGARDRREGFWPGRRDEDATVAAKGLGGSADVRRDRQAEQAQVAHL